MAAIDIYTASESEEQIALFQWAGIMQARFPALALLHHIPNGGQRARTTAVRLKAEGVKAGVPDVSLPIPKGVYHGLYVEMKAGKNKPTAYQLWWLERLAANGYHTYTAYGWREAADVITRYLELQEDQTL
jgi:hypothetical protein